MMSIFAMSRHEVLRERYGFITPSFVVVICLVVTSLGLGIYYWRPLNGLSIDDSYIFLQYAQNLAERGEMSFNKGDHSLGVTSLAWTILLAAAHRVFGGSLIVEAQILGALLLGASASYWTAAFRGLGGGWPLSILVGIALITDPFLVCHSISGMESALNLAVLSAIVLHICKRRGRVDLVTGILSGLAFLTRPDNLVVLPALVTAVALGVGRDERPPWLDRARECAILCVGFTIVSLPLSLWSYLRLGSVIPPTRIGKLLVFLPVNYGLTFAQFGSLGVMGHMSIAVKCFTERILPMFTTECERAVLPAVIAGMCSLIILALRRWKDRFLCIFLVGYSGALIASYALMFPLVKDRHLSNIHSIAIAGVGILGLYMRLEKSTNMGSQTRQLDWAWITSRRFVAQGVLGLSIIGRLLFASHYRAAYLRRIANIYVGCVSGRAVSAACPSEARLALEPIGAIKYCSQRYVLDMGGLATRDTWESISEVQGVWLE